ncbi:MAG: DUF5615 family PIN-like protein [Gemmatimonadota bacterium]
MDNALSPFLARELQRLGHDAAHVRDYHLEASGDEVVFERAAQEDRALVSATPTLRCSWRCEER